MATESEIRSWIGGQTRDWNQLCQALMWQLANRFGSIQSTPPSAIDAWNMEVAAGRAVAGGTPPPGTFPYWAIGQYGHVGFMMNGGRVFMGTSHLAEVWGDWNAGWNTLAGYNGATGARYLGYSSANGGNRVPFTPEGGTAGGGGTPILGKEPLVFVVSYKGWFGVVLPAENGKLFASVLGAQDDFSALPRLAYSDQFPSSWQQFRSRLVNPDAVPA